MHAHFSVATLDEALNEVFRQRRAFGIFFRSEVLEYVCELLPEVQGFLKLLMTIKQQNIHRLQLIHISMPLKFLSNFGSNFRHGHIERIHGLDFRCRSQPIPITRQNSLFRITPCRGGARSLREIGWVDDHGCLSLVCVR